MEDHLVSAPCVGHRKHEGLPVIDDADVGNETCVEDVVKALRLRDRPLR
jgi:hypothetical protein